MATPDSSETLTVPEPRAIYAPSDADWAVGNAWRSWGKAARYMEAWRYVIDMRSYVADGRDNWQTPYWTRWRKKGDCEDSTVWFIALCRAAGVRPDRVFNAVGPTQFGYHSFPIIFLDDEDVQDLQLDAAGWYIFESTLPKRPPNPIPLKGSAYWVDDGLANWRFCGQLHEAALSEFNGKPKQTAGARVENNDEKHARIVDYWRSNENG